MKILVVGGGGREHAIIHSLLKSKKVEKIYCAPGNGGISCMAECVPIKATDIDNMLKFALENKIDLTVIAPDDPLVLGMTDAFEAKGLRVYGPSKAAAAIEGSKVFSKDLMKKYDIPTAKYEVFTSPELALEYIKGIGKFPAVIKAEGLALGKGVVLALSIEEAKQALDEMMVQKVFGDAGSRVVIEEFLTGPEVSVLAFVDGKTVVPMVEAQDHKRALDGDNGLNTGGMGTVTPCKVYTDEVARLCMEQIFQPTVDAMSAEGKPFKGTLFFGLMITQDGPKVIEYNCRFGDPETQVVLPRLKTDLLEIMEAVIDGKLNEISIEWYDGAAACVVVASGGYPGKYDAGLEIKGLNQQGQIDSVTVYHAGTRLEEEKFKTAGGRVLGITAMGDNLQDALDTAYCLIEKIKFEGMQFRRDIGEKNL